MLRALVDRLADGVQGLAIFLPLVLVMVPTVWWCARTYFRILRKGYRPPFAQAAVFVVAFAGFMVGVLPTLGLHSRSWGAVALQLVGSFVSGGVAAAVAVALLAVLLPRRNLRRAGARPTSFLVSPRFRVVEGVVRGLAGVSVLVALSAFAWWTVDGAVHLLTLAGSLVAMPAVLAYWRHRAGAPTIEQALSDDLRAPVLHLRPFDQDAGTFSWVRSDELSRYSRAPSTSSMRRVYPLSMERYLGDEFSRRVGPMVALGNPVDYLPPEGAARRYLPDGGWQPYLLGVAESAVAIVMQFGPSDNLSWELGEIRERGWQHKMFVVTPPAARPGRLVDRWFVRAYSAARRVPAVHWPDAVDQLRRAGYAMDGFRLPGPGAVVGFDDRARAVCLAEGAAAPHEFVGVVADRLGVDALPDRCDDLPDDAGERADEATLLAVQPDRLSEIWALAKRESWADRPFRSELRPLATSLLPAETLVGCVRVNITFTQALVALLTDSHLHLSHDGSDERCRALLAEFPSRFRAGANRVRVPRARLAEPLGCDDTALVIGLAGRQPVRLPVHTMQARYVRFGELLSGSP